MIIRILKTVTHLGVTYTAGDTSDVEDRTALYLVGMTWAERATPSADIQAAQDLAALADTSAVGFISQTLTTPQKTQARANIGAISASEAPTPPTTWQNVTWVDATRGSNTTGLIGRHDYPFAGIKAAYDACIAAGGRWLIHIRASTTEYTDTGMAFGDADSTVGFRYDFGAVHRITGSGDAYTLDAASAGKDCCIFGYATVWADNNTTGKWIDYTSWEAQRLLHIEAHSVNNKDSYAGSATRSHAIVYVQSSPVEPSTISIGTLDAFGNTSSYFRLGGNYVYMNGNDWRGVDFDCSCVHLMDIKFCTHFILGKNNFSVGQYRMRGFRSPKGTSTPAMRLRTGILHVFGGEAEASDAAQPILLIPSDASTTAGACIAYLGNVRMRVWGSTSGTCIPIYFAAANSNFKVTLDNCTIVQENTSGGTYCIDAVGAQEVEVIGTLTTTLAKGSNISLRSGTGTHVVSATLNTGY